MSLDKHKTIKRSPLSLVLYVFSGLALALGAILLFLLIGTARSVAGYDIFFQLAGVEQLAQVVLRPVQVGPINIGGLVFVLMLAKGGLLFTVGQLVAHQANLTDRVRVLEEKIVMGGNNRLQEENYEGRN